MLLEQLVNFVGLEFATSGIGSIVDYLTDFGVHRLGQIQAVL